MSNIGVLTIKSRVRVTLVCWLYVAQVYSAADWQRALAQGPQLDESVDLVVVQTSGEQPHNAGKPFDVHLHRLPQVSLQLD